MALNFEALREATAEGHPPYTKDAKEQRQATINRLISLGVSQEVIATMCLVDVESVKRWQKNGTSPLRYSGRRALDRVGPVIQHMEDDLGLRGEDIATFLNKEPRHLHDPDASADDGYWHKPLVTRISVVPHMQPYFYPFFDNPKIQDGLVHMQERLKLRFAERQVEAQAGVVATPETIV